MSWALKCKHTKEVLALVRLQLRQPVGLRPQPVPRSQLEDGAQVDGVVPAVCLAGAPLWLELAGRPDGAQQGGAASGGVRVAPHPVAEWRQALPRRLPVPVPAGHLERGLAVDEEEAGGGDEDGVAAELEASLGEGLALIAPPLQLLLPLLVVLDAACKPTNTLKVSKHTNKHA